MVKKKDKEKERLKLVAKLEVLLAQPHMASRALDDEADRKAVAEGLAVWIQREFKHG